MAYKADKKYIFTMVGATGAVGKEVISILSSRKFPLKELRLIASSKSQNRTVTFEGNELPIQALSQSAFEGADFAFFSAGSPVSKEYVPMATKAGALVIDNTSAFRMDPDVPLAVPEVNPHVLSKIPQKRIVSVPNCSTVQMVVALFPLHKASKIKRIVVSTYQSTSGAGKKAMEELARQVGDLFNYRATANNAFPYRIAFNLIPEIGGFEKNASSVEEAKICAETKKIFEDPTIGVSATAVRVPTFHCHALSINMETQEPLSPENAKKILSKASGVVLADQPSDHLYPLVTEVQGKDEVYVGRIRKDDSRENCLNLWVVADNLRKGAALNGIQIAEYFIEKGLI